MEQRRADKFDIWPQKTKLVEEGIIYPLCLP